MKYRQLARLQQLERQRQARDERPQIDTLEVYCDGELVEVRPLPYRLYEQDEDGRRRYIEPDEAQLAFDEKIRRLVHGERVAGQQCPT